jgi:lysine 2,3-aminomutase
LDAPDIVDTPQKLQECVDYVRSRRQVRDVLLSGGDILTLDDGRVLEFVDAFASLPQVEIVRLCTRAPAVNPSRITARLAKALGKSKKVWVNTQFNCADEVTLEAKKAASLLVEAGVPVSCQTVLLKGVNDSGAEMLKLLRALSAARIRPYYVFQCDPIDGIDHFRVPLEKAKEIENYCAERIGGLSLPRFVADIPKAKRKIPIDML